MYAPEKAPETPKNEVEKKEEPKEDEKDSEESDEDSDDQYDQDAIEEQIERIDNDIAAIERQLNTERAKEIKEAAEKAGESDENTDKKGNGFPDVLLEEYRKTHALIPALEIPPEKELISKILDENRKLSKDFDQLNQKRVTDLYQLGTPNEVPQSPQEPEVLLESQPVDAVVASALRKRILTDIAVQDYLDAELTEQYTKLHTSWLRRAKQLDDKVSQRLAETISQMDESTPRSRRGRQESAPQELDWDLSASMDQGQESRMRERSAREPPMDFYKPQIFHDNNHYVADPAKELADFNEAMRMKWSEAEQDEFKRNLILFDKNFDKISEMLPSKSTTDCVYYFYREKVNLHFKQILRRALNGGRGRRRKDKEEPKEVVPDFKTYNLEADEVYVPRRQLMDDFHSSQEEDDDMPEDQPEKKPEETIWSEEEKARALRGFELFGRDFANIATIVQSKSEEECKAFFSEVRRKEKTSGPGRKPKESKGEKRGPKPKKKEEVVEEGDPEGKKRKKPEEEGEKRKRKKKNEDGEQEGATGDAAPRKTISYWSVAEKAEFLKLFAKFGQDWDNIAKALGTKSAIQVRNYYTNSRAKLQLDQIAAPKETPPPVQPTVRPPITQSPYPPDPPPLRQPVFEYANQLVKQVGQAINYLSNSSQAPAQPYPYRPPYPPSVEYPYMHHGREYYYEQEYERRESFQEAGPSEEPSEPVKEESTPKAPHSMAHLLAPASPEQ
ncbi:hypothetical protein EDD86DRAFT_246323 [Gorgonomyces haynaldii]|nr:hypothetical protein EDD86DRAFT_246323 [Gorgonomyces haynaldii]